MKLLLLFVLLVTVQADLKMKPPSITSQFKDVYYLQERQVVNRVFSCQATGTEPIVYKWYFKKQLSDDYWGQPLEATINRNVSGGSLQIIEARYDYYGVYQCRASNVKGTALSSYIFLKEALLQPSTSTDIHQQEAKLNEPLKLACIGSTKCVPKEECRVEWKKGQGTTINVEQNERIAVDTEGNLHFLYVAYSDAATAEAPYGCGIWNGITNTLLKVSKTTVTVVEDGNSADTAVVEPVFFNNVEAKIGTVAVLQCIFTGKPVPDVKWYDPSNNLIDPARDADYSYGAFSVDKKETGTNSRRLLIKNVSERFAGIYKCQGNQVGSSVVSSDAKVRLTVTGPPKFREPLRPQIKAVDSSAKFTCDAAAIGMESQLETPIWYENGQEITSNMVGDSSRKFSMSANKKELSVNNLRKEYTCNIQCAVSSKRVGTGEYDGTTFADTYLVVIDKTKFLTTPESSVKLRGGEKISFYINATGDDQFPLTYKWTFTKTGEQTPVKQIDFKPQQILTDENRNLTIDTTEVEENTVPDFVGTYTVLAGNEHDTLTFTVTVELDDSLIVQPQKPVIQTAQFDVGIIAIIAGIVFLIIVIVLIICLLHRNRGGDYNVDKKELAAGHDPAKELENGGLHELSRAYDDKPNDDRLSLTDNKDNLSSDDDDEYKEYDMDDDTGKFNEDGSFIGQYGDKRHTNQSTV